MADLRTLDLARLRISEGLALLNVVSKGGARLEYIDAEHYAALRELFYAVARSDLAHNPGVRDAYNKIIQTAINSNHTYYDPQPVEPILPEDLSAEVRAEILAVVGAEE